MIRVDKEVFWDSVLWTKFTKGFYGKVSQENYEKVFISMTRLYHLLSAHRNTIEEYLK